MNVHQRRAWFEGAGLRGELLLSFCSHCQICTTIAVIQQPLKHKTTWMQFGAMQHHITDFITVREEGWCDFCIIQPMCRPGGWSSAPSALEISALPRPVISMCLLWRPGAKNLGISNLKTSDTVTNLHSLLRLHLKETNFEGGSGKEQWENLKGLGSASSKAATGWLGEQKPFAVVSGDLWTAAKSQYWDLGKVAVAMGWAHCQGGRFQDLQPPGNT